MEATSILKGWVQLKFRQRYGPWGIVAGASEGLGAEYARVLASRGLNVILIARREELIQKLAAELSASYGITTRVLALDLSLPDAAEQIVQRTMDVEIGLFVYNAAFSAVGSFLDQSMNQHMQQVHTNIHAPLKLVYLLGQHMMKRRRGGIILMSSLSAFQGSAYISSYAATKAFNIVLAESLWEEWRSHSVDILVCVSGAVKTPNFVSSRPRRTGGLGDMTMTPQQVVHETMDALGKQPFVIPGRMNRFASFVMRHLLPRTWTIKFMGRTLRGMYVSSPDDFER